MAALTVSTRYSGNHVEPDACSAVRHHHLLQGLLVVWVRLDPVCVPRQQPPGSAAVNSNRDTTAFAFAHGGGSAAATGPTAARGAP
jgi:hypothetical protein